MKKFTKILIIAIVAVAAIIIVLFITKPFNGGGSNNPEDIVKAYYSKIEKGGSYNIRGLVMNYDNLDKEEQAMIDSYVNDYKKFIESHKGIKSIEIIKSILNEPKTEAVVTIKIIFNDDKDESMTQQLKKINEEWKILP